MKTLGTMLGLMALTAIVGCTAHADLEAAEAPEEKESTSNDAASSSPATSPPTLDASVPAPKTPAKSEYDAMFEPAVAAPDATKVDGVWNTVADGDGVAKAEARLAFRGDHLVLATRCTSASEVVTVGVTVKGHYEDGTLNVLESDESAQSFDVGGGKTANCRASLSMGQAPYALEGGKLAVLGLTLSKVSD